MTNCTNIFRRFLESISLLLLMGIMSCGGSNLSTNPLPPDPIKVQDKINAAWEEYEAAHYGNALSLFNEARELDQTVLDIYNGLGWSNFKLHNLILSLSNFSTAITPDSSFTDAMVGFSISAFEKNEYDLAIMLMNTVTRIDSSLFDIQGTNEYTFTHDASVTSRKVRKILALCYYYSGMFLQSYNQLKSFLDPFTKVDPETETFILDLLSALGKI